MKPFWVTFYSYKGGVGRSLALANTAALLAQKGRRVVLIDFDLEAPGLDSFDEFSTASCNAGVVEYVGEYLREKKVPDIKDFVYECELLNAPRGKLWLMPAGRRDRAYNKMLAQISWADLYEKEFGVYFFENWKNSINEEFQPDYVFVDSRTGLTEVGGVCTTQLPDLVVMLFGLNSQNIDGIKAVAESIRSSGADCAPLFHYVASPIPNIPPEQRVSNRRGVESRSFIADRLEIASEKFGAKGISSIRYFAPAALHEKLFVLDPAMLDQLIVRDYERLHHDIINYNTRGVDYLLSQADKEMKAGDLEKASKIASLLYREMPNHPESLLLKSRIALLEGNSVEARKLAFEAFKFDPLYKPAYVFLCDHCKKVGDWELLQSVYEQLLVLEERLSVSEKCELHDEYAELMMVQSRYNLAVNYYSRAPHLAGSGTSAPGLLLCSYFNLTEAKRRAENIIEVESWRKIIDYFAEYKIADATMATQANNWQAIHIAYACSGDIPKAFDALRRARKFAELVGEFDDIFSVQFYRLVDANVFIESNIEMEKALCVGKLWDGMRLLGSEPKGAEPNGA